MQDETEMVESEDVYGVAKRESRWRRIRDRVSLWWGWHRPRLHFGYCPSELPEPVSFGTSDGPVAGSFPEGAAFSKDALISIFPEPIQVYCDRPEVDPGFLQVRAEEVARAAALRLNEEFMRGGPVREVVDYRWKPGEYPSIAYDWPEVTGRA